MSPTRTLEFVLDYGPLNRAQLWSLAGDRRVEYLLAMFELLEQLGPDEFVKRRETLAAAWLPGSQAPEAP